MKLSFTRRMVSAALSGELEGVATEADSVFGLHIPAEVPGVPKGILNPRLTWSNGVDYDVAAKRLAAMFEKNFSRFEDHVPVGVKEAGPK